MYYSKARASDKKTAAPSDQQAAPRFSITDRLLQAERDSSSDGEEGHRPPGLLHPQVARFHEEPRRAGAERATRTATVGELRLRGVAEGCRNLHVVQARSGEHVRLKHRSRHRHIPDQAGEAAGELRVP